MNSDKKGMKAVIYARYSSHGQSERSIEGQLQDCYEYAKRMEISVVGEYVDRALTGTNDNRASFQRMIADASKKQFQYVIVYKLDRFARNRYDSAIYKAKLKKYGVTVLSAMEQISDTPEGIILESVLEGMAEYYSANLSQNVKRGIKVALQNKTFIGGTPPYGYFVKNKNVYIDEKKAPAVKYIFSQYANGVSKREIIKSLNEKGFRTSNGSRFVLNSLSHILNNKKYIGIQEVCGEEYEGIFPPLIDKDIFDKASKQLEKHKRAPGSGKAAVEYILNSKLFCGHCGAPMVGDCGTSRHGTRYYYYVCAARKKTAGACDKRREKKDFIEWYVVEQTLAYVLTPQRIDYIAKKCVEIYKKEFAFNQVKFLEQKIKKIDREIDKLVDLALEARSAAITKKVDLRADELSAQKAELEQELTKIKIANRVSLTEDDIKKWLKSFCKGDLFDMEFRKDIINTFVNSVYLFDDKVIIYYNIKDGKQVSYIEMLDDVKEFGEFSDSSMEKSSDFNSLAPPKRLKSETVFIFNKDVFGIIIPRN